MRKNNKRIFYYYILKILTKIYFILKIINELYE